MQSVYWGSYVQTVHQRPACYGNLSAYVELINIWRPLRLWRLCTQTMNLSPQFLTSNQYVETINSCSLRTFTNRGPSIGVSYLHLYANIEIIYFSDFPYCVALFSYISRDLPQLQVSYFRMCFIPNHI
jgi:hypothetical protein